jgi:hypothetical protein
VKFKGKIHLRIWAVLLAVAMVLTSVQLPVNAAEGIVVREIDLDGYAVTTSTEKATTPDGREGTVVYKNVDNAGYGYVTVTIGNLTSTKKGIVFSRWIKASDSSTVDKSYDAYQSEDLYAVWKCEITFAPSGVSTTNNEKLFNEPGYVELGDTKNLPKASNVTVGKQTYEFVGWTLGGTEVITELSNVTEPTTVYALWNVPYEVTYDSGDGAFPDGTKKSTVTATTQKVANSISNETIKLPKATNPGFLLKGWSTSEGNIVGKAGDDYEVTGNTTLTAIWVPCPHKDANGSTWEPVAGTDQHICSDCGKTGSHSFDDDDDDVCNDCGYQKAKITYQKKAGDKEITDKVEYEYVLHYGEAKGTSAAATYKYDEVYYSFVEWEAEGNNEETSTVLSEKILKPTTPKSGWDPDTAYTYTAVYEKAAVVIQGKDKNGDDVIVTSEKELKDSGIDPSTVTLQGDTDSTDPVIKYILDKLKDPDSDVDVDLDLNGNTLTLDKPIEVADGNKLKVEDSTGGGKLVAPQTDDKKCYDFTGWASTENADTEEHTGTESFEVTGPKTLYPVWKESKHNYEPDGDTYHKCKDCGKRVKHEYTKYNTTDHKCEVCGKTQAHDYEPDGDTNHTCFTCYETQAHQFKQLDETYHKCEICQLKAKHIYNDNGVCTVAGCSYTKPANNGNNNNSNNNNGSGDQGAGGSGAGGSGAGGSGAGTPAAASADDDGALVTTGSGTTGSSSASSGTSSTSTTASVSKSFLHLRATKATKTTQTLSWTKVAGAAGYQIYGADCGEKTYKLLKTVKASKRTWKRTGLPEGTYYKYYVIAYKLVDGKKVKLAKSNVIHEVTNGSVYGNPTKVVVDLEETSITVKVKKTTTLSAATIYGDGKLINLNHAKLIRYRSSNKKIATVKKDGTVTGKKAGTCYIYCYGVNGVYKKVKVTVTKK